MCNCYTLPSIPTCSESIELSGLVVDTDVFIYVQNIAGYVHRYSGTTDEAGGITIDISEPENYYHTDSSFEIWATLQTDNERLEFTFGEETFTCLYQSFFLVSSHD